MPGYLQRMKNLELVFKLPRYLVLCFLFILFPLERYVHEIEKDVLAKHVLSKFGVVESDDVLPFTDEEALFERMDLSPHPKPIFVKFFVKSCTVCHRLKKVSLFLALSLLFSHARLVFSTLCHSHERDG